MAPQCAVCHEHESKYKCPTCTIRYCSLTCYKTHKLQHSEIVQANNTTTASTNPAPEPPVSTTPLPPSSSSAGVKSDLFTAFDSDPAFLNLLNRYPLLRTQLQTVYALTLDPGPLAHEGENEESGAKNWRNTRGGGSGGRFHRGRGRGGRGGFQGDHDAAKVKPWTKERGEREALGALRRMVRSHDTSGGGGGRDEELAEGMGEFIELCRMRFMSSE